MFRRGPALGAAAGALAVFASLWLPWFSRRLSGLVSALDVERSVSGWRAVGGLGGVVGVLVAAALVWAAARGRAVAVSGLWLVIPGALLVMVTVAVTVSEVGAEEATTTTPAPGLAVAFAGAAAVVLVGMGTLVREARDRSRSP